MMLIHVVLEVGAPEDERVASVYNLHHQLRSFDSPPQLPPNAQVALERSHEQVLEVGQSGRGKQR